MHRTFALVEVTVVLANVHHMDCGRERQTKHHELPCADCSGGAGYSAVAPSSHRERPICAHPSCLLEWQARRPSLHHPASDDALQGLLLQSNDFEAHKTYCCNWLGPHLLRGCVLSSTLRLQVGIGPSRSSNYMGEEHKKLWSIRSWCGAHPLASGRKFSIV